MPLLEAPAEYLVSSPEHSLQAELPLLLAAPVGPVALAQVRLPPPEVQHHHHYQQQVHQHPTQIHRRQLARRNSFDRDVANVEETQHFPAFVHLLPVVLPQQVPEPTLDELLRRVTQRTDLEAVETVRLRVISYTISLSRLSLFLPRLQNLDLSGSVLSSLRDLGYGLLQLTNLNISNCGLNSFDGTSGLPAIKVLIADGNMIQRVDPLVELSQLRVLRARNNRISELGLLSFLGMCPLLMEVELQGNPVCRLPLYRDMLRRSVTTLQLLDGNTLNTAADIAVQIVENDESPSSLSSEVSAGSNESTGRPSTAPAPAQLSLNSSIRRQLSATSTSTPVAGSVLGLVRQRRHLGHAWVSSSSGSSSASSAFSSRAPSRSSCSSSSSLDMQSSYSFTPHSTVD